MFEQCAGALIKCDDDGHEGMYGVVIQAWLTYLTLTNQGSYMYTTLTKAHQAMAEMITHRLDGTWEHWIDGELQATQENVMHITYGLILDAEHIVLGSAPITDFFKQLWRLMEYSANSRWQTVNRLVWPLLGTWKRGEIDPLLWPEHN